MRVEPLYVRLRWRVLCRYCGRVMRQGIPGAETVGGICPTCKGRLLPVSGLACRN